MLSRHHGHMGKRGDKWAQTGGGWAAQDWEESKPPKWRLWSGASPKAEGRPPWRKGAGKMKDSSGKTQFPAYDARRPEDMTIVPVQELRTSDLAAPPSTGPSLISLIQGAVNQARKLDAKMNKLQKDLTDGRLQWDAYVADLKTALKTQKARFLQEQERITKELHHTKELREQAYRQLKPFNAGGVDTGPMAMELSGDIEEWTEIARELEAPPDGKADGPLLKLMQALQQAGISTESPMPAVPATPPRRETQVPPATPPHATKTLAQARSPLSGGGTPTGDEALKDPYLSSPGLAHFGVHSASAGHVSGAMPAAPMASNVEAQRGENASGDASEAGDGATSRLAERLSEKRRAKRRALAPFGVVRTDQTDKDTIEGGDATSPPPTPSMPAGKPVSAIMSDDDSEELDTASMASPGLTRLE